ncbi:MAG: retropepsin-like aspartic protease [Cyanobacteria bacterium P01_F01_bin.42]
MKLPPRVLLAPGLCVSLLLVGGNGLSYRKIQVRAQVIAPKSANQAIVQLKGLELQPPTSQGMADVQLNSEPSSRRLTIELLMKDKPETFLVDTGASTTLLSRSAADRFNLEGQFVSGDRLSSAVAGDDCPTMDAHLHRLPPFTIGALQVRDLQGLTFVNTQIPHGLSGVLGMNLLSSFDLKIDPPTRRLSLLPPTPLPARKRSQALPLQNKLGVMVAKLMLNQRGPFTFLLDTGAQSTFISPQVAQATQANQMPRQAVQVLGFCGLEPAYRVSMPTLQLGVHRVQNIDTIVLDSSVITALEVDGILGQNVFQQFSQHWRFASPARPQGSLLLTPSLP